MPGLMAGMPQADGGRGGDGGVGGRERAGKRGRDGEGDGGKGELEQLLQRKTARDQRLAVRCA